MLGTATAAPSGTTWPARIAGWALISACVLLVAVGVVAGERTASYHDLEAAVASGDVDQVTVSQGYTGEFQGYATVDVYWRTLGGWHVAQVVEQHPLRRDRINGLPVVYDVGTVAFVAKPSYVKSATSLYDGVVRAVAVPAARSLDIDTEIDMAFAELILDRNLGGGT